MWLLYQVAIQFQLFTVQCNTRLNGKELKPDVLVSGSRLEHVCDMCGKAYLNVKSLRMHISIHHNKVPTNQPITSLDF